MGKPTGFLEFERETPTARKPLDRIKDWNEFYLDFSEEKLREQGARCMNCGTPFCHTGKIVAGAAMGCPLNNLIPEWNDLVYKGLWKEAYYRLIKTNSFPEFTGRVCPASCEGSCTVSLNQKAVTIKNIELSIIEKAFANGWVKPRIPANRTGKRVAVIGSGPSGLACADALNQEGHLVTVYERADRPGGLLMYGIPNMKLDKEIVMRRIRLMESEGINFKLNSEIGKDVQAKSIMEEYDATVLCCGAKKPRDLAVPGRELKVIYFAVDFLTQNTQSLLNSGLTDNSFISANGKDVVVIGGGDTGTDCVATSVRHGCRSIVQLEIMPKPPACRQNDNPWPQWPKVYSQDYGQQEAAAVFGEDPRKYCIMTKRIIGDSFGNAAEIEAVEVNWVKDDNGRMVPREVPDSTIRLKAQLILIAMGFTGPEDELLASMGIERDQRSNVLTEEGKFSTNIKGVFAAGDIRRGQSLVAWAINEGRRAAKECNDFLSSC